MLPIDLHTHSNISDGSCTPMELIDAAKACGIQVLALTDHDTVDGIAIVSDYAKSQGIQLISGVELSARWSRPSTKKSYGVHIVALDLQDFAPMHEALTIQKEERATRAAQICEKLEDILKQPIWSDVLQRVDSEADRVTRTHIAQVLVAKGIVSRPQQAFDRYLKEGKKAYVAFQGLEMGDAIQLIHRCGGQAVLAHPTKYDLSATNIRFLIEYFAQLGGDAVELPPRHDPHSQRQMIDRMLATHHLLASIGSDYHGTAMPWIKLGQVPSLHDGQQGIWQRFHSPIQL